MADGLICAYHFDGKGQAQLLDIQQFGTQRDGYDWIHLNRESPDTLEWLAGPAGLDAIAVEALTAEETRPRLVEMEQGTLIFLRGVNLNPGAAPEDMVSVRVFIGDRRIITVRLRQVKLEDFRARIQTPGQAPKNQGEFVAWFSRILFRRMEPVVAEYTEDMDTLEEMVLKGPLSECRRDLTRLRLQSTEVQRFIALQREVMAQLLHSEHRWLLKPAKILIRENLDLITRYVEDLDLLRERATIMQEEVRAHFSERLSRNMYVLSIISSIFLPLTFLTGLYGINVAGIPWAQDPHAFWTFVALLCGVLSVQLFIFRRLRWL